MSRVKRGTIHTKRRKNILKLAKGYRFGRSTKLKQAREAVLHAGNHAFRHRKDKKRDNRRLWQLKINAALRPLEVSYSKFINMLSTKEIQLDRKSLAYLAEHRPEAFKKVVETVK